MNEREQADLVAYLDGELSGPAARELEARLSLSPEARAEADALRRTWELLDHLPRPEPSSDFTHRTLERIAPLRCAGNPKSEARNPKRAGRFRVCFGFRASDFGFGGSWAWLSVGWVAALLLAGAAGYAGFGRLVPRQPTEQDLVRDLRLIENKRLYDAVGDVEFLHAIDELFGDDPSGDDPVVFGKREDQPGQTTSGSSFLLPPSSFIGLLTLSMVAVPDPTAVDLERNRQLLEKWRQDPDHDARLQQDLRAFWTLPAWRRDHLRQLDRELHEADPPTRKRLWTILGRYHAWLERLPESQRQQIEAASDWHERLRLVKEIRRQQWLDALPRQVRDDLSQLPADQRGARIDSLQQEERRHRVEWQKARPLRLPTRVAELPPDFQLYVKKVLEPHLNDREKERLHQAEGKWVTLAPTLLALSDAHPLLPPLPRGAVTRYDALPAEARRLLPRRYLERTGQWQKLHSLEGHWPEFALAVAELLKREEAHPPPLGASWPGELPPRTQAFLRKRLLLRLTAEEKARLTRAEGSWPDYPRLLLELARKHRLGVPGMTLPGSRDVWESPLKKG